MTIQVILTDDQPLVRAGLRMLIDQTPDIDVTGEAGTGAEVVRLARDTGLTRRLIGQFTGQPRSDRKPRELAARRACAIAADDRTVGAMVIR